MTNEEARKILLAKIKCIETQLSGRADCVMRVCNKCDWLYKQGTWDEYISALNTACKALEVER